MAPTSDPYAVLGVSRAYHPDVNPAPDAAARFDEVQQAFHLLSDPAARAGYDRAGKQPEPSRARTAQGARRPAKGAPGILVHPAAVDFGLLPKWDGIVAAVTFSWAGAPPSRLITYTPGQVWWTILWFVLRAERDAHLDADPREFRAVRWFGLDEPRDWADGGYDPEMHRFTGKLASVLGA